MENTTSPALAEGEIPIAIIQITGHAPYHLILLPGDVEDVTHDAAAEWATSICGELPNRHEQALLFAHARDQFERDDYWSAERHESDPDYAWYQNFYYGGQSDSHRDDLLRARAVRRLPIQSFTNSLEAAQ
ncbi:DUF1566 domain-containing protein [Thauera butanivorans]|uniref:DUF1566 domain-containing protein n=1 Tax=Thauera butanivorans TaxID=86174 RepID=UPI000A064D90|nr:DUF1566 domain-containing protein [Thauera butanivorans]